MSVILYLGQHMSLFHVWALVVILYIGHDVPFCKKCIVDMIFNTCARAHNTHTHTHTFHGMCFMNCSFCLFDVDE
jgi:hypothetical protein